MKLSFSSKRTFALCLTMSILFIVLLIYGIFATSVLSDDTQFSSENAKDCKNSHLKQVHVVSNDSLHVFPFKSRALLNVCLFSLFFMYFYSVFSSRPTNTR